MFCKQINEFNKKKLFSNISSVKSLQVKKMFGDTNTKPLLLPIVYDLANLVREGFLRSDKYQEHEPQNTNQFLRRSFVVDSKKATKEVEFSAPSNNYRDETLQVDEDDEPRIKNSEKIDDIKAEPLMLVLNSSLTDRPKTTFSLPRAQENSHPRNLSREEIEDLAFSGLNGTSHETFKDETGSSISPSALIGRYRKKNPQGYKSPGPFPETCERFTGGICLNVKNYPVGDIMGSIRRHRHAMEALLAEFRDKSAELENLDYLGDPTADLADLR